MKVTNYALAVKKKKEEKEKKIKDLDSPNMSPSFKRSKFGTFRETGEKNFEEISPNSPTKSHVSGRPSITGSSPQASNRKTMMSKNWSKAGNAIGYMAKSKTLIAPKHIDRTLGKYFS